MSSTASKLELVIESEGRARASLESLRKRYGVGPEAFDKSPQQVIVRAPSQTEWWARIGPELYELARTVAAAKPVPVTP